MTKTGEPPMQVATRFRINLFWMGHAPMISHKTYKLKMGALRSPVKLVEVVTVLDATELTTVSNKEQVDRHDVAEVLLEVPRPIAFDTIDTIEQTGRLVIVDDYEIAGAGIVLSVEPVVESMLEAHIREREMAWKPSAISNAQRTSLYGHGAKFVVLISESPAIGEGLARELERHLFNLNDKVYYLGMDNVVRGLDSDLHAEIDLHDEQIRRLGELARIMTASGQIFITSISQVDDYDLKTLKLLNHPYEILSVNIGTHNFDYFNPDILLEPDISMADGVNTICAWLRQQNVIIDYQI